MEIDVETAKIGAVRPFASDRKDALPFLVL